MLSGRGSVRGRHLTTLTLLLLLLLLLNGENGWKTSSITLIRNGSRPSRSVRVVEGQSGRWLMGGRTTRRMRTNTPVVATATTTNATTHDITTIITTTNARGVIGMMMHEMRGARKTIGVIGTRRGNGGDS